MAIQIKNTSGAEGTWNGKTLAVDEYFAIPETTRYEWVDDDQVFADIANGNLTVNDGSEDITSPTEGWKLLQGNVTFPLSDIDPNKISVHPSYRPAIAGTNTYAIWSGCGDDMAISPQGLGQGDLLHFRMHEQTGSPAGSPFEPEKVAKQVHFDRVHGRVWIHEAYLKFENGGMGDYISADFIGYASQVQPFVDKYLILDGTRVKAAPPGSPYAPTHGWAATPVLIPRTYSNDGDWDYDSTSGLTPNFTQTGKYNIYTEEKTAHRFVNRISCYGTSPYFTMSSDETIELLPGYYIEIRVTNNSNTTWHADVIMEIYRERTFVP